MPHLRIYGTPLNDITQSRLEEMVGVLQETIAGISDLGIKQENIFIEFPADRRISRGIGGVIVCDAVLFDAPERTCEVRKKFAEKITKTIQEFFPDAMVKCMVFGFDRSLGYSTREPINKREGGE